MHSQTIKNSIPTIFLITCLAVLAHSGGLLSPFIYDDTPTIIHNYHIRELGRFQEKVGIENIFNRSATLLTYAVNFELGGMKVFGYHLLNILFHVLTSVTLFYTTKELLTLDSIQQAQSNLPCWAGSLFAAHPIATQSVTYLSNRSSILATFFSLLAFYLFIRFVRIRTKRKSFIENFYFLILILTAFLLGCASKAIAVVIPLLAATFLGFRFSRSLKDILPSVILVLSPLIIYFTYRTWQLGSPFQLQQEPAHNEINSFSYFLTQLNVVVYYYGQKMIWPFNLNFEPDAPLISGFLDTTWIVPSLILLLIAWKAYNTTSKIFQFGFLWTLIAILPTSSFVPLKQLASEHRMYLPSIGFIIVLSSCFQIFGRWRKISRFFILGFLILFTLTSSHRQLDYRSGIHLWYDTVDKSPKKIFLYNNLATDLIEIGRLDEAEHLLHRALGQDPTYSPAHINLGNILYKKGRIEEAQKIFDGILQFGVQDKVAFYNAGLTRFDLGKLFEALPFFQKAAQLDPDFAPYHFSLGNTYRRLQRYDEALSEYKLALKYDPYHVDSMNNRGVIFLKLNQLILAEKDFKKTLALVNNHPSALKNLAVTRLFQKRYDDALSLLDRYLILKPNNIQALQARRATRLILGKEGL